MRDDVLARCDDIGGDFFEQIIAAIYEARVKPGDRVVDVGANWGRHTVPLAERVGRRGRVVAIEALPHLAKNLGEMTRHLRQVRVIGKAASHDEGATAFQWVKKDEGFSGIRERSMPDDLKSDVAVISVGKSTLDKIVGYRRWPFGRRISFVKIDVEGGEYDVLRGAKQLLSSHAPIVVFESGGATAAAAYGYTEQEFFGLFSALGYEVFDIFGRLLTSRLWNAPDTPWYAIAVKAGSGDLVFVRDELPGLVERAFDLSAA